MGLIPATNKEVPSMNTRGSDTQSQLHIERKIPLWGVVCVCGLIAGQAVMMYIGQREQGTLLQQTVAQNIDLSVQIKELRNEIGQRNLKDVERDLRAGDFERRLRVMEDARALKRP
jgi:hypothetical protein